MALISILIAALFTQPLGQPGGLARAREMLADNNHPRGQSQAALLLLQDPSPLAAETVRRCLRDRTQAGAFAALCAGIVALADGRFQEELLESIGSENPETVSSAIQALAAALDDNKLDRLGAFLLDRKGMEKVRLPAARILAKTGRKNAVAFLIQVLEEPADPLTKPSRDLLVGLIGLDFGANYAPWKNWIDQRKNHSKEKWLEEILGVREARLARIEGELENTRIKNRALYSQLYGRLNPAEKLPFLHSLAVHEDPSARALAVQWLADSLAEDSLRREVGAGLLTLSRDASPEVCRQAILALGKWNDPASLNQLLSLSTHEQPLIRGAVVRSLASLARGAEQNKNLTVVLAALNRALKDPAQEVVVEAAEELGALGVNSAGPVLVSLLGNNPAAVRKIAAGALERVAGMQLLDDLLIHLNDPLPSVRLALLGAISRATVQPAGLAEVDSLRLQARLESLLLLDNDPGVRSRSGALLAQLGGLKNLPGLWKAVKGDQDSRVREKAWMAMLVILARNGDVKLVLDWEQIIAQEMPHQVVAYLSAVEAQWPATNQGQRNSRNLISKALVARALASKQWRVAWLALRSLPAHGSHEEARQRLGQLILAIEMALNENAASEVLSMVVMGRLFLSSNPEMQGRLDDFACQASALVPPTP
ncbi:MAG: HEAT repeat domain-containing protein [Gemmataceae bacterium]|nr:HEAT repeat domain-containing protein [Gemmataceae bacterium]